MNIFIVDLKDKPGELAKSTEAIAQKGISITAFSGITCGDTGKVAFLTNDEIGTRKALADAGYRAHEVEAVTTTLEHKPGTLAETARGRRRSNGRTVPGFGPGRFYCAVST